MMEFTQIQKLLIYGLKLSKAEKETQMGVCLFLETEEQQLLMIDYLRHNPEATEQEILNEMGAILEATQAKKSEISSED